MVSHCASDRDVVWGAVCVVHRYRVCLLSGLYITRWPVSSAGVGTVGPLSMDQWLSSLYFTITGETVTPRLARLDSYPTISCEFDRNIEIVDRFHW